jgi:cell filamentation protein
MSLEYDPYVYKGTKVLKNKLDIKDPQKAQELENRLSFYRIKELAENPIVGSFNYLHLQSIHQHIFQDIYEWAGKPRTTKVSKAEPLLKGLSVAYPNPNDDLPDNNLDLRAEYAFKALKKDNHLKGLDRPQFIAKLIDHATEIWETHPFRDGNTRTIVTFIDLLAKNANHDMKIGFYFKNIKEVRDAFVLSTVGKAKGLRDIISLSLRQDGDSSIQKIHSDQNEIYQFKKSIKSKGLSF